MRWDRIVAVVAALLLGQLFLSSPTAQPPTSSWSVPVNLGVPINTPFTEGGGALSADGLSFYFASGRPCSEGDAGPDNNLWVAYRSSRMTPWQVECLRINVDRLDPGPQLSGYFDSVPELSRDEHWLYFVSDRAGSAGTGDRRDIWVSWRDDIRDHQGWSEPVNLGPPVNTDAAEGGPAHSFGRHVGLPGNEKLIFNSSRGGSSDLWEVDLFGGVPFAAARRLDEVSTQELLEAAPSVSSNGLELFFQRGTPTGPHDIFTSTRLDPNSAWSAPISLGSPVNTGFQEAVPHLSRDGTTLFFQSNRPGGLGGLDIWVSHRIINGARGR